jgi:hypothetical protein
MSRPDLAQRGFLLQCTICVAPAHDDALCSLGNKTIAEEKVHLRFRFLSHKIELLSKYVQRNAGRHLLGFGQTIKR